MDIRPQIDFKQQLVTDYNFSKQIFISHSLAKHHHVLNLIYISPN